MLRQIRVDRYGGYLDEDDVEPDGRRFLKHGGPATFHHYSSFFPFIIFVHHSRISQHCVAKHTPCDVRFYLSPVLIEY